MFEQSQLELASRQQGKPASMIAGFILQATMLTGALLFSLIFTEAVPRLRFDGSLIAPPRAKRSFIPIEQPQQPPVPVHLTRRPAGFYAPPAIPRDIVIFNEPQAPEIRDISIPEGFLPYDGENNDGHSSLLFPDTEQSSVTPPPPPPPAHSVEPSKEPVRVPSTLAAAKLVHRVQPIYPLLAIQTRIQGTVKLEAMISETGEIINLRAISGHPLLIPAALGAVSQWRYQPTLLNGTSVAVITTVDVNFVLGGN